MFKSLFKSFTSFFIQEDPYAKIRSDEFIKIATIQDAVEKLYEIYSPLDLKRCEEITDLLRTIREAHTFNPLTPINTLPASKKHLISKYL
ncbi:MAG: hypothetical protein Q7U54_15665 [Bacteroidales bacterium]|jgi:hypothetical protein|nr:hypothetical protein [Bacteroidales bacterium]